MLDPFITPCCDQKLLRYFFERVDGIGYSTFFSEADYGLAQFLEWMISRHPKSEFTLAVPELDETTINVIKGYLSKSIFDYPTKSHLPMINHLNLIVGKGQDVPDEIVNSKLVTVAKDTFTYSYLLMHRVYGADASSKTVEEDTQTEIANLKALTEKAETLSAMLSEGNATSLASEELEGAWIDYILSSNLATSSKGIYYTLHGMVSPRRETVHRTSSVTCIKGKRAYDEVMNTLSSVLRTKKVKATN